MCECVSARASVCTPACGKVCVAMHVYRNGIAMTMGEQWIWQWLWPGWRTRTFACVICSCCVAIWCRWEARLIWKLEKLNESSGYQSALFSLTVLLCEINRNKAAAILFSFACVTQKKSAGTYVSWAANPLNTLSLISDWPCETWSVFCFINVIYLLILNVAIK